ncbi:MULTISPECIES: hypothetical protein [Streptomyces]|uniref:Uncharacterized protein n=1 Tax=Streptomyces halstedii TaxID=1944 RepID=A0A6N9U751_STRHA|nr:MULTISPECIES: hypothetical protein [Streptomyces]AWL38852.1 hypothetical protein B9S64_12550 [Streptomyces sp. SM18]NEA19661.1 hypothetical protein [Streptomyces halstedii]
MTIANALHEISTYTTRFLGPIGTTALVLFLLLYAGVILPAVWSRRPYRRAAAHRTLTTLLNHLDTLLRALRGIRPR